MNDKYSLKKKFLKELLSNQLPHISPNRRLLYKDLSRISKYIDVSIFDETNCCIWKGYVTNEKNTKKGTYINFFFRNKKVALHRLLYDNFVGPLSDDYYLKFTCDDVNKGKCCNIHHMIKNKYNDNSNKLSTTSENSNDNKKKELSQFDSNIDDDKNIKNALTISFD